MLLIGGNLDWTAGTITGGTQVLNEGTLSVIGTGAILDNATLLNYYRNAKISVNAGGTLDVRNGSSIFNFGNNSNQAWFDVNGGSVTNSAGAASFTNYGLLTLEATFTTGTFVNAGRFNLNGGGSATFAGSATQIELPGAQPPPNNELFFSPLPASPLPAETNFSGGSMTAQGAQGYEVTSGTLTNGRNASTITGNLTNSGGTIDLGDVTYKLNVSGNYTQSAGTLIVHVDAFQQATNSSLAVTGKISLAAMLLVSFTAPKLGPGVTPPWSIITYGNTAGTDFAMPIRTNGPMVIHLTPDQNNTYKIGFPKMKADAANWTEGLPNTVIAANFSDSTDSDFTATISWGDGSVSTASTSDGSICPDTNGLGGWDVNGTHTYDEGTDTITVVVTPTANPSQTFTKMSTVTVADGALTGASTFNGTATVGVPFERVVATFSDANPAATAADFSATITWGDATSSAGVVSAGSNGGWQVSGAHAYAQSGFMSVSVFIQDDGGQKTGGAGIITVSPPPAPAVSLPDLPAAPALVTALPAVPLASTADAAAALPPIPIAPQAPDGMAATASAASPPSAPSGGAPGASAAPPPTVSVPALPDDLLNALAANLAAPTPAAPDGATNPLAAPLATADACFAAL